MNNISERTAEKILNDAASHIGKTDWYFNLHFYRLVYILNIILKRKRDTKKEIVLELGVWPGYLALSLQNADFEVRGVDIDPSRVRQICSQIRIENYDLNQRPIKLPFPENNFDYIVASEIIEHIDPDNLPGLFFEIHRLLNRDGLAIITTPNKNSLHNILSCKNNNPSEAINGHGHIREYTLDELQELIKKSPLILTKSKTVNFYSNIGTLPLGKYFYPLKDFWKYSNKLFNLLKFCSIPLKQFPAFKDSIILLVQKND